MSFIMKSTVQCLVRTKHKINAATTTCSVKMHLVSLDEIFVS